MRDRKMINRERLQAAGALAAFAFVVGLSAPNAGIIDESVTAGTTTAGSTMAADITEGEMLVLATIAYHQPVTRAGLSDILGREVSRDTIGQLRRLDLIASGPRSPQPGAPYTYVTTRKFLEHFGLDSLRDLPDLEALEDAGLVSQSAAGAHTTPANDEDSTDPWS